MPVSIVIGGQFGSEGKGKVALELARAAIEPNVAVVRVGGPNSGHTGYDRSGKKFALRQLPAGCIDRNVDVVFPAGSYIDVDILLEEIALLDYPRDRIFINHHASIITESHKNWERDACLTRSIGSTGSGTGAAVMALVARNAEGFPLTVHDAAHCEPLADFLCDTTHLMRGWLSKTYRIIIEGTQGFGLSLLDGGYWPKATARGTTASAALAESGLSPMDVDDVFLVLRSFPIRVAGDSGPLSQETTWEFIAQAASIERDISEFTTVTKKLRRVGLFEATLVVRAIEANNPTKIVMNHMDYVGREIDISDPKSKVSKFLAKFLFETGRKIDYLGFSGLSLCPAGSESAEYEC